MRGWALGFGVGLTVLASASQAVAAGPGPELVPMPAPTPRVDDGGFAVGVPTPEALARYARAAAYSRAHRGLALLVIEGDAVVFEEAENGHDLAKPVHLWSGTKAFQCALVMAAVADGKVALDERIADTLTEWRADPQKAGITVRQLLDFTSGLSDASPILTSDAASPVQKIPDKSAWALAHLAIATPPGSTFRYHSSHPVMLATFLGRKLGEEPLAYLARRVLGPLGLVPPGLVPNAWMRDPAGHAYFAFGASLTPRSWARYGAFLRDRGSFRGQAILPSGLVDRCFVGSESMPAFGAGLWFNGTLTTAQRARIPGALTPSFAKAGEAVMAGGPADLVTSAGYRDQRMYLVPSERLIVVRLGRGDPHFVDAELLGLLLPRR